MGEWRSEFVGVRDGLVGDYGLVVSASSAYEWKRKVMIVTGPCHTMTHQAFQYHVKELGEVKSAPCSAGLSNSQGKSNAEQTTSPATCLLVTATHRNTTPFGPVCAITSSNPSHQAYNILPTLRPAALVATPQTTRIFNNHAQTITLQCIMSATESTGVAVAANTTPKPKGFFSLPRELRDEIYDILHQHKVEAELAQLVFKFRCPSVNVRLINRQFTEEFNMRTPPTDCSQLSVTQKRASPVWEAYKQPTRIPKVPATMQNTRFTQLEFEFDLADGYRVDDDKLSSFIHYVKWIDYLVQQDPRLVIPWRGGKIHLQLSCRYVSNLSLLFDKMSYNHWFEDICTKMSLVLHGSQVSTPTMKKLGLHIYSDEAQVLAAWSRTSGWKVEKEVSQQADIEIKSGMDPLEPPSVASEECVDDFVDGSHNRMQGSGSDANEQRREVGLEGMAVEKKSLVVAVFRRARESPRREVDDNLIVLAGSQ